MFGRLVFVAAILTLWAPLEAEAGGLGPLGRIKAAAPRCPAEATKCVGIRLHVVFEKNRPIQTAAWIARQITEANARYAATGIGFELTKVVRLPPSAMKIRNKTQRDRLGRLGYKARDINVFVVGRLDNVDEPGEINGVHWRNRRKRGQRWIIMSKIAWRVVLAHELGHYFGLPHSDYPESIMNKNRGGDRPPEETWTFHLDEVEKLKEGCQRLVDRGQLKLRQASP